MSRKINIKQINASSIPDDKIIKTSGDSFVFSDVFYGSGGTGGEINTASNVGTGIGLFSQKVGSDLRFKSLMAGPNIILSGNSTMIIISGSPSGEINTASNVGNGVNLFKQKDGFDLEFRTISGTPNQITVTSGTNIVIISLPQDINLQSEPRFKKIYLGSGGTYVEITKTEMDINGDNFQIAVNDGNLSLNTSGRVILNSLFGVGDRMVVVDSNGTLSATTISNYNIGDITGATNIGGGINVFNNKLGNDLRFRTLSGRTNQINISASTDLISFSLPQDITSTSSVNFANLNISGTIINTGTVSATTVIVNKIITASAFTSTVLTGTKPFNINSTTLVTNLNADLIDNIQGSQLVTGGTNLGSGVQIFSGKTNNQLNFRTVFGDPTIQISANTTTATVMYKPIIIVTGDSPTGVYPDGAIWIQI